jgi:hypothetical protein
MEQAIDPKVIARIKKLHNMAEGARDVGSLAEADSFMEAVHKTLAAHNLDMSALSVDLRDLTDPLGSTGQRGIGDDPKMSRHRDKGPVEWVIDLATAVAEAHYCASNYSVKSSYVWFYGRKNNREISQRMFVYLRDMAERLGWEAYVIEVKRRRTEYGSERGAGQWRLNWLEGYVSEVSKRYRAMRARVESDKGMSMVLTGLRKEADAESSKDAGARWKKAIVPDQPGCAPFVGKRLYDVSYGAPSLLTNITGKEWSIPKLPFVSELRAYIKYLGECGYFLSAESHNEGARLAGADAARNVNLHPSVLDSQPASTQKQLRGA